VYGLFRRWQRDGTWAWIVAGLQAAADAEGLICWQVSVDSTICRAHQHAAGARRESGRQREPPAGRGGAEPADHGLGRSRGALSTKIHLACEQGQKPLAVIITGGQCGDSPQFTAVLQAICVPRQGPGRPASGRSRCGRTRPTHRGPTGPGCAGAASPPPFPNPLTRPVTAPAGDRPAGGWRWRWSMRWPGRAGGGCWSGSPRPGAPVRWPWLMPAMAITPPSGWNWRTGTGSTWSRSKAPPAPMPVMYRGLVRRGSARAGPGERRGPARVSRR
jgi:hypothetical protein